MFYLTYNLEPGALLSRMTWFTLLQQSKENKLTVNSTFPRQNDEEKYHERWKTGEVAGQIPICETNASKLSHLKGNWTLDRVN